MTQLRARTPSPAQSAEEPAALREPSRSREVAAARFLSLIADKLVAVEERLAEHLASDVPFIDQSGRYLTAAGGKRLRPAMVLLAAQLLGHDGEEEVTYGAVVELIHTATLVHDDVIDHAATRRGRRALHELAGNNRTVLLGDWIYTTSMALALAHGRVEVIRRLCAATLRMTEGELLVLQRLGAMDVTADEYLDIIDRKTAQLFAAACSLPALIDPVDRKAQQALERYGQRLGLTFQLVDDLLDFTARAEELGKPVLSDLKEGKLTLPLILALPRIGDGGRKKVRAVLEDRGFERTAPEEILALVEAEGTLDEARQLAETFAAEAREALGALPEGAARDALEQAPRFVLDRRS